MEEKYITKLLTFSDENLMGNVETISLTRKNVKELLNELHQNYIPISIIEKKIEKETLPLTIVGGRRNKKTLEYGIKLGRIQAFKEILDERNNTDE